MSGCFANRHLGYMLYLLATRDSGCITNADSGFVGHTKNFKLCCN